MHELLSLLHRIHNNSVRPGGCREVLVPAALSGYSRLTAWTDKSLQHNMRSTASWVVQMCTIMCIQYQQTIPTGIKQRVFVLCVSNSEQKVLGSSCEDAEISESLGWHGFPSVGWGHCPVCRYMHAYIHRGARKLGFFMCNHVFIVQKWYTDSEAYIVSIWNFLLLSLIVAFYTLGRGQDLVRTTTH